MLTAALSMVNSVNGEYLNASLPILVTDSGIITVVKSVL